MGVSRDRDELNPDRAIYPPGTMTEDRRLAETFPVTT